MMNMNGLLNGTKPHQNGVTGCTPNQTQKTNQVALPRDVIGKSGEGNKPYICKGEIWLILYESLFLSKMSDVIKICIK